MSTEIEALEADARARPRLREDLAAFVSGSALALVLLWYIHGTWQPNWALVCGVVGGVITRRDMLCGAACLLLLAGCAPRNRHLEDAVDANARVLAERRPPVTRFLDTFVSLAKLMAQYARLHGVHQFRPR
jgi:hypothetical protein